MVEIRYGEQHEKADLTGQTVSEIREQFRAEFGIPDKAKARLNGAKIKRSAELDTVLNDSDKVTFVVAKNRGAYMVGALLLALAITGSVFAYGFINATTTLNATVSDSNFADVSISSEAGNLTWTGYGFYKGSITGPWGLFNVNTSTSGYTGDLVVSVGIGNADALSKYYRVLALKLELVNPDSANATMDINEDNVASSSTDWVLLTLENGSVSMFPAGNSGNMTVRVKSGFYITHVRPFGGWPGGGNPDPDLFCEVAQR